MSIPAVRAIRDRFSNAHMTWLVEGSVSEFLASQDFINDVIVFPRGEIMGAIKEGNISRLRQVASGFVRNLRRREYDVIIDFHGIAKSALFSMIARRKRTIGF